MGPRPEEDAGDPGLLQPPEECRVVRDDDRLQTGRGVEDGVVRIPRGLDHPESRCETESAPGLAYALCEPSQFVHHGGWDEDLMIPEKSAELRLQVHAELERE